MKAGMPSSRLLSRLRSSIHRQFQNEEPYEPVLWRPDNASPLDWWEWFPPVRLTKAEVKEWNRLTHEAGRFFSSLNHAKKDMEVIVNKLERHCKDQVAHTHGIEYEYGDAWEAAYNI
jgi:hypothetical protein